MNRQCRERMDPYPGNFNRTGVFKVDLLINQAGPCAQVVSNVAHAHYATLAILWASSTERRIEAIRSSSLAKSIPRNKKPGLRHCPWVINRGPSGPAILIGCVQVHEPAGSRRNLFTKSTSVMMRPQSSGRRKRTNIPLSATPKQKTSRRWSRSQFQFS